MCKVLVACLYLHIYRWRIFATMLVTTNSGFLWQRFQTDFTRKVAENDELNFRKNISKFKWVENTTTCRYEPLTMAFSAALRHGRGYAYDVDLGQQKPHLRKCSEPPAIAVVSGQRQITTAASRRTIKCFFGLLIVFSIKRVLANRPPQFLTTAQTEIILRLKEGVVSPTGTLIYVLRGFDEDGDTLTFGIKEQAGSDVVKIENLGNNEANLYLNKELDREIRDEYLVVLTLTDGHLGEGNFITQSLLLLVEDVNDNAPIFKPYQGSIVVAENSEPHILTTVEATDLDEGPYGQVIYYLQEFDDDNNQHLFSISTVNGKGVIRLTGRLDFEKLSFHQLRILATDRAADNNKKTATATILVTVEDVEDQPPEFVMVTPVARIYEDAPIRSSVSQVKAVDGDKGVNNKIRYSISGVSGKAEDMFGIDANSGMVFTLKKLDREQPSANNGAYIVHITAEEESKTTYPFPAVHTELTIIIMDINDEAPAFRSDHYVAEINENSQTNTAVTLVGSAAPQIYDYDQGSNGSFKITIEDDGGIFDVNPREGINEVSFIIRVKNAVLLDYEQLKVINFTLIAKETVPKNAKLTRVPVTVYVIDVNDNFPEFTRTHYEVNVSENCISGTTIARVAAKDRDSNQYGTEGIRYTAVRGSIADKLELNFFSGIITVKANQSVFDRERTEKHYVNVEARDDLGLGNRNTVQLIINVNDVNDNAPVFFLSQYEVKLRENENDFNVPLVIKATDSDMNGTANSEIRYSIIGSDIGEDNFTIDAVEGVLKVKHAIDFEKLPADLLGVSNNNVKKIGLVVEARDCGNPSLASRVPVIVYVEDVNDHEPRFEQLAYVASIPEDSQPGYPILQVKALDEDGSSPNNAVVYRIQNGAEDKFILEATSGFIRVARGATLSTDRVDMTAGATTTVGSKSKIYSLMVIAFDGGIGDEQRNSVVWVNITIKDVNDKTPVLLDPGTVRVKENTPARTVVHKLMAWDPDEKPNLRFKIEDDQCEARNEDGSIVKPGDYDFISAFELNPIDGVFKTRRPIDRERVQTIKMTFKVEDLAAAKGKQETFGVLTIIIEDENDNNPTFRKPFYHKSIMENSQRGLTILNIVADDVDENRTITYSMEYTGTTTASVAVEQLLHLDRDTGELTVAGRIDHEQMSWLNLTVRATDSGFPNHSSQVNVFVRIIDENDNNPYFVERTTSNISVPEDIRVGSVVTTVEAKDIDSGDYGKVTYLLDRISSQGKFSIDANTGVLTINDKLDRESTGSYTLILEAWDNYQYGYANGESRNTFKQITIVVMDANDNAPVFENIPRDECVTISEFHETEDTVVALKIWDADDPNTRNAKVSLRIEKGDELGLFEITKLDSWTFSLRTTRSLSRLYGNYTLSLLASDAGQPPQSTSATISICVMDFNDNVPRFISPNQNVTIRIAENAGVGSTVVTVKAVDDDQGLNGAVRYSLKQDLAAHWKTFAIDENTGTITLHKELNRRRQKLYSLRVEARDLGSPTSLSSDLDLIVYVRNVKAYQPQFLVDEFTVHFTEGQQPGTEQWKLIDTTDSDRVGDDELDDLPAPVCYYIVTGNERGYFALDPLNHKITALKMLDRESSDTHSLVVKASNDCTLAPEDGLSNAAAFDPHDDSTLKVVIRINDINDNAPKFTKKVFTGGVTAEMNFGAEFMQLKANDADIGINAKLSYYIISDPQISHGEGLENIPTPLFAIDRHSGSLFLNFDPQKKMKGYFDFHVKVNDTGGLEDAARVLVYLLRADQRVKFIFRQNPAQLRGKIDRFIDVLSTVTGAIVNVDECKTHEHNDGRVDKTRSDLYAHFVNQINNSVMEGANVLRLIDENIERLDEIFKEFNVLETEAAETDQFSEACTISGNVVLWIYMAGSSIFFTLLLIVITCLYLTERYKYRRQLKAATISVFESSNSDFTKPTNMSGSVPNTNIHSNEGSNPMWLQAYENEWYKGEDSSSQFSERDSLDENVISTISQSAFEASLDFCSSASIDTNKVDKKDAIKNAVITFTRNGGDDDRRAVTRSDTNDREAYFVNKFEAESNGTTNRSTRDNERISKKIVIADAIVNSEPSIPSIKAIETTEL